MEIIIVLAAIGILTADIVVRLFIAPRKRERFVADLLNIMYEPGVPAASAAMHVHPNHLWDALGEGLLRHFTQSWLSCRILEILAASKPGMCEMDILTEINLALVEKGRQPLPEVAVRKVLMILLGADFVTLHHGTLSLTGQGRNLHRVVAEGRRKPAESLPAAG